eukprot:TRINITY_DN18167_c0_g1_i4.p1 TRINITY_DN18167_c0_g1~~TRINITY_DN18167_c0_g1_i4.p1  ORF type:complete len:196 (+),score=7.50 TRINITY_DN18167_c0_g1_i4:258-845(+)
MHQSADDGSKIAAAIKLPDASTGDDSGVVNPLVTFSKRWPPEHEIARTRDPEEFSIGDCMILHGSSWETPVCILHADTGDVDVVRLHPPPNNEGTRRRPREARRYFLHTTMNAARSLFFGVMAAPARTPWKPAAVLCIWHVSGPLLAMHDIGNEGPPTQLAVHPTLPLIVIETYQDEEGVQSDTLLLRLDPPRQD